MARVKKWTGALFTGAEKFTPEVLSQIQKERGLSSTPTLADIQEYKDTGSFSQWLTSPAAANQQGSPSQDVRERLPAATFDVPGTPARVDTSNASYGKDPAVDNVLESQYLNQKNYLTESYLEKVWRETWITADIQNIDDKILDTYKII